MTAEKLIQLRKILATYDDSELYEKDNLEYIMRKFSCGLIDCEFCQTVENGLCRNEIPF